MKYGMQSEEPLENPFLETRPRSDDERKLASVPQRVGSGRGAEPATGVDAVGGAKITIAVARIEKATSLSSHACGSGRF